MGHKRSYDWDAKVAAAGAVVDPGRAKPDVMGARHSLRVAAGRLAPQPDMGRQHQSDRYVSGPRAAGIVQSMSRKGNCLDNACTEGPFGHMKDELFRGRDRDDFESFKEDLEAHIARRNTRRRRKGLRGLTPEGFRSQSLMAV